MGMGVAYINALGENAILYRRELGARNAVTNWPATTWVADGDFFCEDYDCGDFDCTCIKIFVDEITTREVDTSGGRVTEKRMRAYVPVVVAPMDHIDYHTEMFQVEADITSEYHLAAIDYYKAMLLKVS